MKKQQPVNIGDQYKIRETGHTLIVQSRDKNKNFRVHYYDNSKEDLILNEDQINHYLKFDSWIKTKI